jgi:hypothetical protein
MHIGAVQRALRRTTHPDGAPGLVIGPPIS